MTIRGDIRHETLERMLVHRQAELRARLRSLREEHPSDAGVVKDEEELSSDAFALGLDIALIEMESDTLQRIDEAISRLEAGTYGVCGECSDAISEARLQALPFATVCRDCQAQRETAAAAHSVSR